MGAKRHSKISFRVFSGTGPLSVYWTDGPYGDAEDTVSGRGVSWISPSGDTLGVEFDDVSESEDQQELKLRNGYIISISVKNGKVKVQKRRCSCSHNLPLLQMES